MPDTDPITRLNTALEGRYRIQRELGAGGMATVYLAEDVRHRRNVALKVLRPELAALVGSARFLAEIETTANLQHPHILPLFDSGEADGFLFYVMPHVEGESLRERLDRDRHLPVDEAVDIVSDVASALDYAHGQGVVHRDIKPANILLSGTGEPLVADFGIALAVSAGGGDRLTQTGLSLGTPHYMSPEQATGDVSVGPSTDIYALGCVLYESLVGEPPYAGSTPQAVLGKIITEPPPAVTKARRTVRPNVEAVVTRALEKIPADRFTTAEELRRALGDPDFRAEGVERSPVGARTWQRLAVGSSILAVLLSTAVAWLLVRPRPSAAPSFAFPEPFLEGEAPHPFSPFELTSDGSALVYVGAAASGDGQRLQQLWVRRWDELEARRLPGTEATGQISFAISPDGESVAYVARDPSGDARELQRVPMEGGEPRGLGVNGAIVTAWGADDKVYYHTGSAVALGTFRVAASGGEPETVAEPEVGEWQLGYVPMDGGDWGVVAVHDIGDLRPDAAELRVVEQGGGQPAPLSDGHSPRLSSTGHLLFATATGTLMAAPVGGPGVVRVDEAFVALGHQLLMEPGAGVALYTVSETGVLVYATGSAEGQHEFVWIDRAGGVTPVPSGPAFDAPALPNSGFSLSPEHDRIAFQRVVRGNTDIYTFGLADGIVTRLTFDPAPDVQPRWTPDGEDVVYFSGRGSALPFEGHLWRKAVDGGGGPVPLFPDVRAVESAWSPGSEWIALRTLGPEYDIFAARLGTSDPPTPLAVSQEPGVSYFSPAVSPDGRWLAYTSDEGGHGEVVVQAFPDSAGTVWQVSEGGGLEPVWAHRNRELFYIDADRTLVAAEYGVDGNTFRIVARRPLFVIPADVVLTAQSYDVFADDGRFVMVRFRPDAPSGVRRVVRTDFFESLREAGSQ